MKHWIVIMLSTIFTLTTVPATEAFAQDDSRIIFAGTDGTRATILRFDRIDRSSGGEYDVTYIKNVSSVRSISAHRVFPFDAEIDGDHVTVRFHVAGQSCDAWKGRFRRNFDLVRFGIVSATGVRELFQAERVSLRRIPEIETEIARQATFEVGHALREPVFSRYAFYPHCSAVETRRRRTHATEAVAGVRAKAIAELWNARFRIERTAA